MYLQEEKEKVINYLSTQKEHVNDLLKDLKSERDRVLKEEDPSFKDDIEIQYIQIARMIITEDIAKQLAIDTESILYTLECLGTNGLSKYLE